MWKIILKDCERRGISEKEVAQRLGRRLCTLKKWKYYETREPIPLSIDTLARL
jgi:transposase